MKQYEVVPFFTGVFSGSLNDKKLTQALNQKASEGWKLTRTISESKRVMGILKRETKFLIFERDG